MICYVLAMGKQHLEPHVAVGYGIKIFWPGLFITSPDHLDVFELRVQSPLKGCQNCSTELFCKKIYFKGIRPP